MLRSNRTGANAEKTSAARTQKKNAAPGSSVATTACDPYYWLLLHKGQVAMYSSIKYLNDAEGLAGLTTAIVKTAQNSLR